MECPKCHIDREQKDFFGKEICYRCTYRNKTRSRIKKVVERKCYVCDTSIPKSKTYCSDKCKHMQKKIKKLQQATEDFEIDK